MDPLGTGRGSLGICGAQSGNHWLRPFEKHIGWLGPICAD